MSEDSALIAACHCGRATIRLPRKPDSVTRCNCTMCTASGFWGIYYASEELTIQGDFDSYVRSDLWQAYLKMLRCANCGILTHWELLSEPPHEQLGEADAIRAELERMGHIVEHAGEAGDVEGLRGRLAKTAARKKGRSAVDDRISRST